MKKSILTLIIYFFIATPISICQNVAINANGTVGQSSAGLDIDFANKGLLIPRVSLVSIADSTTIPSPANALLVYNTNADIANGSGIGFYFYCSIGCVTRGWKFINFSDANNVTNSEWTYYSKLIFTNSSAQQNFPSLPVHDKWKLVFDIQNSTPSSGIELYIRLNGIVTTSYGTKYTSASPIYGSSWLIYKGGPDAGTGVMSGDVILTGKSFSNRNTKVFFASISGNELYNSYEALSGFLYNDPQNVSLISILTPQGPITGSIELWFKDNR